MRKPRLIDNISVYANATEAERMKYARYLADTRAAGRTPEAFGDWQRDREAPSSETQCPASAGHFYWTVCSTSSGSIGGSEKRQQPTCQRKEVAT
jgi:hypothetical protein